MNDERKFPSFLEWLYEGVRWDKNKANDVFKKHKTRLKDVQRLFFKKLEADLYVMRIKDSMRKYGEVRYSFLGSLDKNNFEGIMTIKDKTGGYVRLITAWKIGNKSFEDRKQKRNWRQWKNMKKNMAGKAKIEELRKRVDARMALKETGDISHLYWDKNAPDYDPDLDPVNYEGEWEGPMIHLRRPNDPPGYNYWERLK